MVRMDNIFSSDPIRLKMLYCKFIFNMFIWFATQELRNIFGFIFYAYYLHFQELKITFKNSNFFHLSKT
jgi:hypothetical protein